MKRSDIETSSKRGVRIGGTAVASATAARSVGQVFEDVELGHDTDGAPRPGRDHRGGVARGQQRERLVEAGRQVDQRKRPIHHLADGPVDRRRVAEGTIEQAFLGDRSDDALDGIALGLLGDREAG